MKPKRKTRYNNEQQARAAFLTEVYLYYWEHKGQYWDTLDDIEEEIGQIRRMTAVAVNNDLVAKYKKGRRSRYERGQLPANWQHRIPPEYRWPKRTA
jgi:hypothetical protein